MRRLVLAFAILLGIASPAQAYVGPGAGLTAIGAFVALVAAVVVSLIAFVWLPIKRRLRGKSGGADPDSDDD
jgi:hypothetical protein